jgi:glucose-1-phosphate thymidylyltransferase
MLEKGRARRPAALPPGVEVIDPVYIEDGVALVASTVGPNVSIGAGSRIERSRIRDTIIGEGTSILDSSLVGSLIGDAAIVDGAQGQLNVSDHSVVKVRS